MNMIMFLMTGAMSTLATELVPNNDIMNMIMFLMTGAMSTLATELVPNNDIRLPSAAFRKVVACALVYKVRMY